MSEEEKNCRCCGAPHGKTGHALCDYCFKGKLDDPKHNCAPAPSQPEASPEPQAREILDWILNSDAAKEFRVKAMIPSHKHATIFPTFQDIADLFVLHAAAQNAALTHEVERLKRELEAEKYMTKEVNMPQLRAAESRLREREEEIARLKAELQSK